MPREGKTSLCFCLILKTFLQIFVVCFRVYPWLINEYAVMVLSYTAIRGEYKKIFKKTWFVSFGRLTKINFWVIFIVEPFQTEMHCMLSEIPFHPSLSLRKTKWAWHLVNFTLNLTNYSVDFVKNVKVNVILILKWSYENILLCTK